MNRESDKLDVATLIWIYEEALRIADKKIQADTSTPEGLLAYFASRYANDAADYLEKLRARQSLAA